MSSISESMLKYYNYDIVFAEIPDEVTLAVNITCCPNHCKGCHSPWLQQDRGEVLDSCAIDALIGRYGGQITCLCFMGGDSNPQEVEHLSVYIRSNYDLIKTAWYSGKPQLPVAIKTSSFDYIKIGEYQEKYGPLNKQTTNQRLYKMNARGEMENITSRFWK